MVGNIDLLIGGRGIATWIGNCPGPVDAILAEVPIRGYRTQSPGMGVNDSIAEADGIACGGHPAGGTHGVSVCTIDVISGTVIVNIGGEARDGQIIFIATFQAIGTCPGGRCGEGRRCRIFHSDRLHMLSGITTFIGGRPRSGDGIGHVVALSRISTLGRCLGVDRSLAAGPAIIGEGQDIRGRQSIAFLGRIRWQGLVKGRGSGILDVDGLITAGGIATVIGGGPCSGNRILIVASARRDHIRMGGHRIHVAVIRYQRQSLACRGEIVTAFGNRVGRTGEVRNGRVLRRDGLYAGTAVAAYICCRPGTCDHGFTRADTTYYTISIQDGDVYRIIAIIRRRRLPLSSGRQVVAAFDNYICRAGDHRRGIINDVDGLQGRGGISARIFDRPNP